MAVEFRGGWMTDNYQAQPDVNRFDVTSISHLRVFLSTIPFTLAPMDQDNRHQVRFSRNVLRS
jgi:hypothetical protein